MMLAVQAPARKRSSSGACPAQAEVHRSSRSVLVCVSEAFHLDLVAGRVVTSVTWGTWLETSARPATSASKGRLAAAGIAAAVVGGVAAGEVA